MSAREPWMEAAVCVSVDPELFFSEYGEMHKARAAKQVCAGCDVQAQCLQYALVQDVRFGVFGGLSPRERWKLRRTA